MTQQELSDRCSLDPSYISLLERERKRPGGDTIFILAIALGMTASEFLKEIEDHPENEWVKERVAQEKRTHKPVFAIA